MSHFRPTLQPAHHTHSAFHLQMDATVEADDQIVRQTPITLQSIVKEQRCELLLSELFISHFSWLVLTMTLSQQ
jgi:hypothetical protein